MSTNHLVETYKFVEPEVVAHTAEGTDYEPEAEVVAHTAEGTDEDGPCPVIIHQGS